MKLTRRMKETLGISMLISAVGLVVTFVAVACRKRSLLAAIALLAAGELVAGACLVEDAKPASRARKAKNALSEEELFTDAECREAHAHIRNVLCGRHEEEPAPRVIREIPRDEDATEADFQ